MSEPAVAAKHGAMPATIYIIRHAEKPASGDGLSPAGHKRAQAYVKYFQHVTSPTGQKIPWKYIFASEDSSSSHRPVLTVTPLAQALKLKIDSDYVDNHFQKLVDHLRQNPATFRNQNVLICWHHGKLLDLAQALGASCEVLPESSAWPSTWPDDVYGWLLKIYFKADGTLDTAETVAVNEELMPDDLQGPNPVYGK